LTAAGLAAPAVAPFAWNGFEGVDLLGPPASIEVPDDMHWCSDEAWEAARIESGIPAMGRELTDGVIPAETGTVERAVSFTKGCFTGQELVARLDARGSKVARRLRGLVIGTGPDGGPIPAGAAPSLVGSAVLTQDGAHEVGRLSSAAWSPGQGGPVALATLHRRVEVPGEVLVLWDPGTGERRIPAQARVLPLTPG
jgi:folate-binding protein YgfZ